LMLHCRTAKHVARLFRVREKDVRRAAKAFINLDEPELAVEANEALCAMPRDEGRERERMGQPFTGQRTVANLSAAKEGLVCRDNGCQCFVTQD
jgi:hypothetical protein